VLEWNEIQAKYGDCTYRQIGPAKVRCKITNDQNGLFTPCQYDVDEVTLIKGKQVKNLREIVSFRGRFAEQASQDEQVLVQGMVEMVECGKERWERFVLGSQPTDILLPSNVL
jgi:predicted nucleotidyltransferase